MTRRYQGTIDSNRRRAKHGGCVGVKEGGEYDPVYRKWKSIKDRCTNPNAQHYDRYGGRGITICDEWKNDFTAFRDYVGVKPSASHTLERIDNNKGYEPGNIRWATRKEQANNRSTNTYITYNGETKSLAEWAAHFDYTYAMLIGRWKAGKRGDDLFAAPQFVKNITYEYRGKQMTIPEISKATGIAYSTVVWRIRNGHPLD